MGKVLLGNVKCGKGDHGTAAGFGTPTVTVDANVGTPTVTVTASGPDTAKVFNFAFKNLKGAPGAPGSKGDPGAPGADGKSITVTSKSVTYQASAPFQTALR